MTLSKKQAAMRVRWRNRKDDKRGALYRKLSHACCVASRLANNPDLREALILASDIFANRERLRKEAK